MPDKQQSSQPLLEQFLECLADIVNVAIVATIELKESNRSLDPFGKIAKWYVILK